MQKEIVLTGITTTGTPHLGNYVGAIRPAVAASRRDDVQSVYFLADLHALVKAQQPDAVHRSSLEVAATWLALGLDADRALFYRQSDVPEIAELNWILMSVTAKGLMNRAHAYKAAVQANEEAGSPDPDRGITMALFCYPVLMAADILLYHSDLVPVGQDQKQHLEMARDMAQRFNHAYGVEALKLPEPHILEDAAIVPGTDGRKMSKSYANTIAMFAPRAEVKKAVMGIVTDSTPVADPKDPTATVFQLWNLFATPQERREMAERARAGGVGYGDVKKDLLARLEAYFAPLRERREQYASRPEAVEAILEEGARRARALALPVLASVREAAGLGTPRART